ncbi:hypothetical protein PoB_002088900 [Plakobranchus ocellatus]|uniref:Uncharacterized protein n=1 Tax=Plakobranchus ocellatus TaxID=259542 RepID=A0AAV3ZJ10_9GAST|nr:hypothetical protein PoB_002088900 [Plakobranchus ocellatus]
MRLNNREQAISLTVPYSFLQSSSYGCGASLGIPLVISNSAIPHSCSLSFSPAHRFIDYTDLERRRFIQQTRSPNSEHTKHNERRQAGGTSTQKTDLFHHSVAV